MLLYHCGRVSPLLKRNKTCGDWLIGEVRQVGDWTEFKRAQGTAPTHSTSITICGDSDQL